MEREIWVLGWGCWGADAVRALRFWLLAIGYEQFMLRVIQKFDFRRTEESHLGVWGASLLGRRVSALATAIQLQLQLHLQLQLLTTRHSERRRKEE